MGDTKHTAQSSHTWPTYGSHGSVKPHHHHHHHHACILYSTSVLVCFRTMGISRRWSQRILLRLQQCWQHEYSWGPLVFGKSLVSFRRVPVRGGAWVLCAHCWGESMFHCSFTFLFFFAFWESRGRSCQSRQCLEDCVLHTSECACSCLSKLICDSEKTLVDAGDYVIFISPVTWFISHALVCVVIISALH